MADAALSERELADLAFAATTFAVNADNLGPRLRESLERNTHEKPTKPFIIVERVRKLAPKSREVTS